MKSGKREKFVVRLGDPLQEGFRVIGVRLDYSAALNNWFVLIGGPKGSLKVMENLARETIGRRVVIRCLGNRFRLTGWLRLSYPKAGEDLMWWLSRCVRRSLGA